MKLGISVVQIPHWDVRIPGKQLIPLLRYVLPEECLYFCEQASNANKDYILKQLEIIMNSGKARVSN